MKIGIDGNEANIENRVGVGQFAYNVLKNLELLDFKNEYTVYLKEKPGLDLPKERKNWKYKIFGPGKLWTQIALPVNLFTQKNKPDVFYSPSHYAPRFSPVPTIISIMDLWHHCHPEQFNKKDLYQLLKWEAYSVKDAAKIITISEFSKSEIVKFYNYPKEKIVVAYPGYQSFRIKNQELRIKDVKNKYGITGDYLLYLGTLQPKKNVSGLIDAFALIIKGKLPVTSYQLSEFNRKPLVTDNRPPITLVIAGKRGWMYEEIFKKVKAFGLEKNVIFTGFVDEEDKPYLISGSIAFVLPSFYEGFGIPVAEAMNLGVPVVCSKEGSLPEVGGEAANYFNPYDCADMAKAIIKVINLNTKQRNEIIDKGKKQAGKFTWENCARVILSAIKSTK